MKKIRIYQVKFLLLFNRTLLFAGVLFALFSTNTSYSQCVIDEYVAMTDSIGSGVDYIGQSFIANVSTIDTVGIWLWPYAGPNQIKFGIAPDDGAGNANETAVLWMSGLIILPVAGQWVYIGGLSIPVTPGLIYHVLIDTTGGGNYGAGYSTSGFTSTGENLKYSVDGGVSWVLWTNPGAIYVSGNCTSCVSPTLSIAGNNPTTCGGSNGSATVTASGGTPPSYTYSWNTVPVQTTATVTGLAAGTYTVTVTNSSCTATATVTLVDPTGTATLVMSKSDVSCNGGSNGTASVAVTGGASPYTYLWSNAATTSSISGLSPGAYTVIVTEANGCDNTNSVTVFQPTAITATLNPFNPTGCVNNDGSIAVTASGGTPGYNYSWNTAPVQTTATATGLAAGTYTVTVTDSSSCTATATATLVAPTGTATLVMSKSDVSCNGGSNGTASVAVTGGVSPYTYLWSNGAVTSSISGLLTGTYMVTVTESNGCDNTNSITVSQPSAIMATFNSTEPSCGNADGGLTVLATGGSWSYTYQWSSSAGNQTSQTATGLSAGTHSVTVTDSDSCSEVFSANLSNFGAPSFSISSTNITCYGNNNGKAWVSFIMGGTPPYSYLWSTGAVADSIFGRPEGTYTLTVTDGTGCKAIQNVVITEPVQLTVSPNYINTTGTLCDGQAIANVAGGTMPYTYSWNTTPVKTTATASGLCMGTYTVTVTDANGCTTSGSVYVDSIPSGIADAADFTVNFNVYPNPILNEATIAFELNKPSTIQLALYDIMGRRLELFIDKKESAGTHFKTINASELNLANGIYMLILVVDGELYYSKVAVLH